MNFHVANADELVEAVSRAALSIIEGKEFSFSDVDLTEQQLNDLAFEAFTNRVNRLLEILIK
jgi:hypothetical protein